MITLFSYPGLFGVADNNTYGLRVFAFLKLCGVIFKHEHIFDATRAPRGQLPYIDHDGEILGDSDTIIAYLIKTLDLPIDRGLTPSQRNMYLLVRRTLDDLYWVMSYSRWKDPDFWPQFRDAFIREHPTVQLAALEKAREYNIQKYHYQGIGRYAPDAAYERGVADLGALTALVPTSEFIFGREPTSIDAAIYGSIANIYFYEIDTPLRKFIASHSNLVRHCNALHVAVR
jgi:glutathione S-transferase